MDRSRAKLEWDSTTRDGEVGRTTREDAWSLGYSRVGLGKQSADGDQTGDLPGQHGRTDITESIWMCHNLYKKFPTS